MSTDETKVEKQPFSGFATVSWGGGERDIQIFLHYVFFSFSYVAKIFFKISLVEISEEREKENLKEHTPDRTSAVYKHNFYVGSYSPQ